MWVVVNFTKDDSVEVVPYCWIIDNTKCRWPPNSYSKVKLKEAIQELQKPEEDWMLFEVDVMGTYDDFKRANRKATKATETDHLSTHDEDQPVLAKRLRMKPRRLQSSSSDDNSEGELEHNPPKFLRRNSTGKNTNRRNALHESPAPRKSIQRDSLSQPRESSPISNSSLWHSQSATVSNRGVTDKGRHHIMHELRAEMDSDRHMGHWNKENSYREKDPLSHLRTNSGSPRYTPSPTVSDNDLRDKEFQRLVMRQLYMIQNRLSEHSENFAVLLKNMGGHNSEPLNIEAEEKLDCSYPIKNENELEVMEVFLTNENNRKLMIQKLARLGGNTVKEITIRIMYELLTNEMASKFSWEGHKGKRKFKTLKLADIILRAIRANQRTSSAQDDEIIKVVKGWLVRAKERDSLTKKKRISQMQGNQDEEEGHREEDINNL